MGKFVFELLADAIGLLSSIALLYLSIGLLAMSDYNDPSHDDEAEYRLQDRIERAEVEDSMRDENHEHWLADKADRGWA